MNFGFVYFGLSFNFKSNFDLYYYSSCYWYLDFNFMDFESSLNFIAIVD